MNDPAELFFVDAETGGLDPAVHALLSFGIVRWVDGVILDSVEFLIQPEHLLIDPRALEVNRIDLAAHAARAMSRAAAALAIPAWITARSRRHPARPGGHNVHFDLGFLAALVGGRPPLDRFLGHRAVDTESAVRLLMDAGLVPPASAALGSTLAVLGLDWPARGRHTARGDALSSARAYTAMLALLRALKQAASTGGARTP